MRRVHWFYPPLLLDAACYFWPLRMMEEAERYPFVLPWDDASHTITDFSFLNHGEAGSDVFIAAKDGHFAEI